jgi:hypothetical protein
MSIVRSARFVAALLVLGATARPAAQSGGQQAPPTPKPGPEHAVLKMDVGTWDAVVEITPGPGAPAMTSKGVEVNTLGCGGLCLVTEFKADIMGTPFQGHGLATWDAAKKKYVGSWTDSMSAGLLLGESTYDPANRKWTGSMEGPDMTGKVTKTRSVVEWVGPNERVFTMYSPGPDGKDVAGMKITYTRRK